MNISLTDEEKVDRSRRINKEVGYEGTCKVDVLSDEFGNVDLGLRSTKR